MCGPLRTGGGRMWNDAGRCRAGTVSSITTTIQPNFGHSRATRLRCFRRVCGKTVGTGNGQARGRGKFVCGNSAAATTRTRGAESRQIRSDPSPSCFVDSSHVSGLRCVRVGIFTQMEERSKQEHATGGPNLASRANGRGCLSLRTFVALLWLFGHLAASRAVRGWTLRTHRAAWACHSSGRSALRSAVVRAGWLSGRVVGGVCIRLQASGLAS